MNKYAAKIKRYIEGIRLMSVDIQVIEWITSEIIPKMSQEEITQRCRGYKLMALRGF